MTKRVITMFLSILMLLSGFATVAVAEEELPWIDIVVDLELSETAGFVDNPNDVVTPWVEEKFHIRVKEVIQGGLVSIGLKERITAGIQAGNLPDVVIAGNENIAMLVGTGYYGGGYEELIENNMPNFNARFESEFWPRFMNNGVKTQIPLMTPDTRNEPYVSDPFTTPMGSWSLWVREDILAKCGYTFEPIKDIAARTTDKGIMPTVDDFAIEPAIATEEDFHELLKKIDALNITVGDAELIPFSSIDWSQFHLGSMFDFGHWRINDAGEVGGFLGTPGAKEYYKYLNTLYQEGLLDQDFIVQTGDQLQGKIASGRVAAGMQIPDMYAANDALKETVGPDAEIRFITWPKADETGLGAYDIFEGGFWRMTLKTDLPEETKVRLIEYFDWFFSDEAMDVMSWGPAEAGLYAVDENGKRYFVDEQTQHDMMNRVTGGKGADYWGLYQPGSYFSYNSRVGACAAYITGWNPYDPIRMAGTPVLDMMSINKALCSLGGYDTTGRYAYGDGTELVGAASSYYWSFAGGDVASLLTATTEEEFDSAWDEIYDDFVYETDYEAAVEQMEAWFAANS